MIDVADARKQKFDAEQAWTMLKSASSISVAKGKKVQCFDDVAAEKEAVLKSVMGPSGNLRAPTYRIGNNYVVGYNLDLYQDWVE